MDSSGELPGIRVHTLVAGAAAALADSGSTASERLAQVCCAGLTARFQSAGHNAAEQVRLSREGTIATGFVGRVQPEWARVAGSNSDPALTPRDTPTTAGDPFVGWIRWIEVLVWTAIHRSSMGDAAGAAVLEREVLTARVKVLGERHADTLTAKSDLALSLLVLGDAAEAAVLVREVLAGRVEVLGERHPDTLTAKANLASSLWPLGERSEGTVLLGEALALQREIIPGHPDTAAMQEVLDRWTEAD